MDGVSADEILDDMEESIPNKKYTTLKMINGDEFMIDETTKQFKKRIETARSGATPGFKT